NQKLNLYHIACSGLAKKIEEADIEENSLNLFLKNYLEELKDKNIDSVVLGCTHYPIIKNSIKSFFENGTKLYDSADAIAKRLKEITKDKIQSEKEQRVTILYSSKINFDMVNIILKDCKYDLRECKI
ncbi:MAG TPA: hypothetical protein K8U92_04675, partial [Aliarcobacter thereius]|nr:hypothetical protein [Aliarcobacter thereius]